MFDHKHELEAHAGHKYYLAMRLKGLIRVPSEADNHEVDSYRTRVVFGRKLEERKDLVDLCRDNMGLFRDTDPYQSDIRRNNGHPYNRTDEMIVRLDKVRAYKDHFLHDDL